MVIFDHFTHLNLSKDQEDALFKLDKFLNSTVPVFMLEGYAGSGKTTILKGLVKYLKSEQRDFALLAPTGRAAKVMSDKTGEEAGTIHRSIYSYELMEEVEGIDTEENSFLYHFKIRPYEVKNKIFIVDEASMISDSRSEGEFYRFGSGFLLSDLITYCRVTHPLACTKIIFVGDPYQLGPVGDPNSRAFEQSYLLDKFRLQSERAEMREVKRQSGDSGILKCASALRKSLSSGFFNDFNLAGNGVDTQIINKVDFLHSWSQACDPKIVIAYKNKTCKSINTIIRELKYGEANLPLRIGDIVIIGANNYSSNIFNGEFAVVNEIGPISKNTVVKFYGKKQPGIKEAVLHEISLSWRFVELMLPDGDQGTRTVRGQVLENFLYGDGNLLPVERRAIYIDFKNRFPKLNPKSAEFKEAIFADQYFNAICMKFGYAVTCHKAQGGEWQNVFTIWDHDNTVEFDYLQDNQKRAGKSNPLFFRWAYTAVTRASSNLYSINPPRFNSYSNLVIVDSPVASSMAEISGVPLQTIDVIFDQTSDVLLSLYKLDDYAIAIQDHFLKVVHLSKINGINITGWEKKNLEVFYKFQRSDEITGVKTWLNKDSIFNNKYLKLPAYSNSESLYKSVETMLKNLPSIAIVRNKKDNDTSSDIYVYEFEFEEKFPFTRNLFDDLTTSLTKESIIIKGLEHLQYKERYTFARQNESAVFDFEYSGSGFFGRVLPLPKLTKNVNLKNEIINVVRQFNQVDYAS